MAEQPSSSKGAKQPPEKTMSAKEASEFRDHMLEVEAVDVQRQLREAVSFKPSFHVGDLSLWI